MWDVGGGERLRPLWATYSRGTDGIVFVVDASCNSDTMEEARLELARILKVSREALVFPEILIKSFNYKKIIDNI